MWTRRIPIGVSVSSYPEKQGLPVMWTMRPYGVTVILGRARSGKTTIAKQIALTAAEERSILIINPYLDTKGDWYGLKWQNLNHDAPQCISNLTIINNLAMKVSSFKEAWDWHSLGVTSQGAYLAAHLAQQVHIHKDDPEVFRQLLHDLPVYPKQVPDFVRLWNLPDWKENLHQQTKDNLTRSFQIANHLGFFWTPESGKIFIEDFGRFFLCHPYLFIDLEDASAGNFKSRAFAGVILRQIMPVLQRMQPLLIIDEADKIAPNINYQVERDIPSSLFYLLEYAIKLQRYGVNMILLTQNPELLTASIARNHHFLITGKLMGPWGPITEKALRGIYNDYDHEIRSFIFYDENYKKTYFQPLPLSCRYWARKQPTYTPL